MTLQTIKVGDYLRDIIDYKLSDGTTKTEYKFYLVLDVSETNIDVIPYHSSPLHIYDIFDIKEIGNDKSVSIIKDIQSEYIYKSYMTHHGNLYRQEYVGTKYTWDDKTAIIPASNIYYSGNTKWKEMPTA